MQVWDLHDETQGVTVFEDRGHDLDFTGPVAALLGVVAIGSALSGGLPVVIRWVLVAVLGTAAVLVALAALRRHQTVLTLAATVIGLLAPIAAGILLSTAPLVPPTAVLNTSMRAATASTTLTRTAAFQALPAAEQRAAGGLASGLVLRLRTLHGDTGPFPAQLALSAGGVVEAGGELQGTPLAPLPEGTRLIYSVTADRSAFRVVVRDTAVPGAAVRADSTLAADVLG